MESECEKGLVVYVRKSSPPPFLLKTYMLVEDPATDHVISWNSDGSAVVVWQPEEFARDLLPTLFKHSNFSSFVRQLNTYGFRKAATSRWEFCNDRFHKGGKELLSQIRRRKSWANKTQSNNTTSENLVAPKESDEDQRSLSTSSSYGYTSLVDENKRLKKENGVLTTELSSMKKKCKELLDLVAMYTSSQKEEEDERPKLFGVRLEAQGKRGRKRELEIDESARILPSVYANK